MEKKWNIREIYLYLVCLITLVMVLIGTVNALQAGFEYLFRPPNSYPLSWELKYPDGAMEPQRKQEMMEAERARIDKEERYRVYRKLFDSIATIVVAGPVYIYHWRKVQKKEFCP